MAFVSNREMDCLAYQMTDMFEGGKDSCSCFDIDAFVKDFLKIPVFYESFAEEKGMVISGFLSNGLTPVTVVRNGKNIEMLFPEGSIVIDKCFRRHHESARRRFILAHEAAHFILDRLEGVSKLARFDRRPVEEYREFSDNFFKSCNFIEAQANRLASHILMPEKKMLELIDRELKGTRINLYDNILVLPEDKMKLSRVAGELGVSYTALLYRLMNFARDRGNHVFNYRNMEELVRKEILRDTKKS